MSAYRSHGLLGVVEQMQQTSRLRAMRDRHMRARTAVGIGESGWHWAELKQPAAHALRPESIAPRARGHAAAGASAAPTPDRPWAA